MSVGLIVIVIAISVLFGWHTGNETLIRVLPGFSPMQYNTAIGLLLCGGGLVFHLWRRELVLTCGILILLLGLLTMIQFLFGSNFGIDEAFNTARFQIENAYPGRMAQVTSLCFLMCGTAFLLRRRNTKRNFSILLTALLGATVTALGTVALVGYLTGIPTRYGWGQFTGMAIHTAVSFILVGTGLIVLALRRVKSEKINSNHWLPTLVTVGTVTATLGLWQILNTQEKTQIEKTVETEAVNLKNQFETEFNTRIIALEQMADRWAQHPNGTPRDEWEADANRYLRDYTSYQAIEWADPSFHIRWVEPPAGNEPVIDLDLSQFPDRKKKLEYARDHRVTVLTHKYPMVQGGPGIIVYTPIFRNDEFGGFIVGAMRAEELFRSSLPRNFAGDYLMQLYDGDKLLFQYGENPVENESFWAQDIEIVSHGVVWKAHISPTAATIEKLHSPADEATLVIGLLMSFLLVTAIYLAQQARRRAFESISINRELNHEIAERHRTTEELRASEQHTRDLIEKSLGFICTHALDGTLLSVNQTAAHALGFEPDELVGRKISEFIPELAQPLFEKYLNRMRENKEMSGVFHPKHKSGEKRVWAFNNTLYESKDGEPYVLGHAHDVTARNRMEDQLKAARNAALESAKIKSEFLANMSHEIRTPMNGVLGMTELLADTPLDDRQQEYVETIRKSGKSLLDIINDVLDFSIIEAGQLKFETIDFDLRHTVENTVEMFAEQAAAKGIELASLVHSDVEVALRGDPGRLRQILTNLIGNAVKFTERGEIIIRVVKDKETKKKTVLRFLVSDTGIGIKPEVQEYLFQAFMQADGSITRRFGGTGLGLTISKQLIEMMNGTISVESEFGRGSTFSFTAVFEKQSVPAAIARRTPPTIKAKDLRILVVDDNETNRNILLHQIRSQGIMAEEAAGGQAALAMLRTAAAAGRAFDLIILDLVMPETDGFKLARLIKADPQIAAVRIILMPSYGRRGHARIAKKVRIDGYLIKPVKQADLFDCIAAVTAGTPTMRENRKPARNKQLVTRHTIKENRYYRKEPILIAEDNPVNQRLIKLQLERIGYRADIVTNGREALAAFGKKSYALILMDCQMPELDGYAATGEIRRLEKEGGHLPIIAITANVLEGEFEKCLRAGMDDYLAKPFSQQELAEMLGKWLGRNAGSGPAPAKKKKTTRATVSPAEKTVQTVRARLSELETDIGPEVVAEIVGLFIEDSSGRLENLRKAAAAKDFPQIRTEAHGLKGSCGNIGAVYFADLCQKVEAAAEVENHQKIVSALKKLEANFPILLEVLQSREKAVQNDRKAVSSKQ